ncbi:MAG TPA: amidase, partial [Anaerolineae bacterium]|nr:amidase [Anaerolineae bacterium]
IASSDKKHITSEEIAQAAKLIGLDFTEAERALMAENVNNSLAGYEEVRTVRLDNSVPPAVSFDPGYSRKPGPVSQPADRHIQLSDVPDLELPADLEALAFYPTTHLAQLLRNQQVSSLALTEMYLQRLKRFGPKLECVVTLTEELALSQARRADEEIAAGNYRGPLHGIPWGAKDLLATRGFPTTWGAMPYKDQVIDVDATVVQRLEEAGAVLVAKLTLGALAWGDVWFGGKTRNPWNLEEGSSGSSAGSASAVAAGLVGFTIGTETHGSIVSPSTKCGASGLRPTFGRVSRHGAMALSWTMDKIGPICRSVEDCAVVFNAIHGADPMDRTAVTQPFQWDPAGIDLSSLRIGYIRSAFEEERDNKAFDDETINVLRALGANLVPVELPDYPMQMLSLFYRAEAAAAFDELTRSGRDELLVRQVKDAWPNVFRAARLIPAVEYIQANRLRTLLMQGMADLMSQVDLYIAPSFSDTLLLTNLTGHPAVVVPNGFSAEGIPASSITFIGDIYGEATTLAVAKMYQDATDFHLRRPAMNW